MVFYGSSLLGMRVRERLLPWTSLAVLAVSAHHAAGARLADAKPHRHRLFDHPWFTSHVGRQRAADAVEWTATYAGGAFFCSAMYFYTINSPAI